MVGVHIAWKVLGITFPTLGLVAYGPKYQGKEDIPGAGLYLGSNIAILYGGAISMATWPVAAGIVTGLVVGTIGSYFIDPEHGIQNFAKYYTGEGNYYSGDPNDSGYFNIPRNLKVVLDETNWRATAGYKPTIAEKNDPWGGMSGIEWSKANR